MLRGIAALSVAGVGALVAQEGLLEAGFRFRWEDEGAARAPGLDPRVRARAARSASTATPSNRQYSGPPGTLAPSLPVPRSEPGAAVGTGPRARIDFARFPGDADVCTPCPVSDQWAEEGLRLSFRSWSSDSDLPFVLDARNFLPPNSSGQALGPALRGDVGLEVGAIQLDFPGRPRTVAFTLYGPDLIGSFDITVWSDGGILGADAVLRALESKYRPAGRGVFRAVRVVVEAPRGIDRISLDGWGPPGHVLLVDRLAIDP